MRWAHQKAPRVREGQKTTDRCELGAVFVRPVELDEFALVRLLGRRVWLVFALVDDDSKASCVNSELLR